MRREDKDTKERGKGKLPAKVKKVSRRKEESESGDEENETERGKLATNIAEKQTKASDEGGASHGSGETNDQSEGKNDEKREKKTGEFGEFTKKFFDEADENTEVGAGRNYDVRHADSTKSVGEIFGQASFIANKIAKAEVSGGRGDMLADFASEKVLKFDSKVARVGTLDGNNLRAGHSASIGAESVAKLPCQREAVGTEEARGSVGLGKLDIERATENGALNLEVGESDSNTATSRGGFSGDGAGNGDSLTSKGGNELCIGNIWSDAAISENNSGEKGKNNRDVSGVKNSQDEQDKGKEETN